MLELGKRQSLTVVKTVDFGVYLSEGEGAGEEVLLPKKEVPEGTKTGDQLEVYLYKDSKDRLIATREEPAIQLGEVALLKVAEAGKIGGFEIPDDIKPLELRELLDKKLDQISPKDEKETYLIHILKEFRPDELYDGQMKELLLWGKGEQYLWSVNIPQ